MEDSPSYVYIYKNAPWISSLEFTTDIVIEVLEA